MEVELTKYDRQNHEFAIDIEADDFNEEIDNSGMVDELKALVEQCTNYCQEHSLTVKALEISSDGVRTLRFKQTVESVMASAGMNISFYYWNGCLLTTPRVEYPSAK